MNPETTTAVVAAIANAPCVKVLRGASYTCGPHEMVHPECAAAAARQWFTDWLREEWPDQQVAEAIIAALGGDQATGGD